MNQPMMNMNQNQMMMNNNQNFQNYLNNMNQNPMMNINQVPMGFNQMQNIQNNINQNNINPGPLLNENIEITNLQDAKKIIKKLIQKLNNLEQNFQDYKRIMEANLFYNQIDPNSYLLDQFFYNLPSKEIIKNREEFGLINKGIKHLFNKNIMTIECKYKSKADDFDPSLFKINFNNIKYSLFIICTKNENKRFGAFYINNSVNPLMAFRPFNMYNPLNNPMNNPIMNNPMINNNNNNNQMNANNTSNTKEDDNIFDSNSSSNNYFIFSLDKLKIYYKEKNILENMIPNFKLIFNKRYESLLGNELPINNNSQNKITTENKNNMNDLYDLSGKGEFRVKCLELYEIKI